MTPLLSRDINVPVFDEILVFTSGFQISTFSNLTIIPLMLIIYWKVIDTKGNIFLHKQIMKLLYLLKFWL